MKERSLTGDNAARLYQGASGQEYHFGKRALRPEALPWVMRLRAAKFQRYVSPRDTVFELGLGAGWNLGQLQCGRRVGCDASGFLEGALAELGIEFLQEIGSMPNESVDVAICHQTLEHLLQPATELAQLKRILKRNGRLILHVPWERERRYSRYRPDEPNHHLYNWNAQNIGNLVTVLGFRIESLSVKQYGYDRFAANLAVSLRAGERTFRLFRGLLIALRPLREVEVVAVNPVANAL